MPSLSRNLPFSLRARFLLATTIVILIISLCWGMVAMLGYIASFEKTSYQMMRGESNLFYTLAEWNNGKFTIHQPQRMALQSPTQVYIFDNQGKLLWQQRHVDEILQKIRPEWLKRSGFYEIDTSNTVSYKALGGYRNEQSRILFDHDQQEIFTHSVAINRYEATRWLPELTIVVIDSIPQELQQASIVWTWFGTVLLANLVLVGPLLWLAAHWSLRPIGHLTRQIHELESNQRTRLDQHSPNELKGLVRNLNILLEHQRQRYTRYSTTLADLTHSLKTPLAVLQSTLRSLRGSNNQAMTEAEPVMLAQINRISQQVSYYLHRASMQADHNPLHREVYPVCSLVDSLCLALNKVYQRKGVTLTLDISPETPFTGDQNDFMEVMGNVLDNACKYCLEFIEISARHHQEALHLIVEDDGPGIVESQRDLIFVRGVRADTLRPGQGLGLAVAHDIVEQYDGEIIATTSPLGGARMEIIFRRQQP